VTGKRRLRILVADDHKKMRLCLIRLLEKDFEVVGSATNGYELIEAASQLRPDVIVSDVRMPLLCGTGAMKALQECGFEIPFVFVSSDPSLVSLVCEAYGPCVHKIEAFSKLSMAVLQAASDRISACLVNNRYPGQSKTSVQ
jgi:CheY-like chemotaxis protein